MITVILIQEAHSLGLKHSNMFSIPRRTWEETSEGHSNTVAALNQCSLESNNACMNEVQGMCDMHIEVFYSFYLCSFSRSTHIEKAARSTTKAKANAQNHK